VRRFCLLKFNSSSSLFPIPLLLLEMLIAGVCGMLGILVGIPALRLRGICWRSLSPLLKSCELSLNLEIQVGQWAFSAFPNRSKQLQYLWIAIPLLVISMFSFIALNKFALGEPSRQFVRMNWLQMRWALTHLL